MKISNNDLAEYKHEYIGIADPKHIREIDDIIDMVADYFDGDLEKIKLWFDIENPLLGGMSPRDMIIYGRHLKLRKFVLSAISN